MQAGRQEVHPPGDPYLCFKLVWPSPGPGLPNHQDNANPFTGARLPPSGARGRGAWGCWHWLGSGLPVGRRRLQQGWRQWSRLGRARGAAAVAGIFRAPPGLAWLLSDGLAFVGVLSGGLGCIRGGVLANGCQTGMGSRRLVLPGLGIQGACLPTFSGVVCGVWQYAFPLP